MMKRVRRTNEIYPDGVGIQVDWDNLQVGMSIFIPCVNTKKAKSMTRTIFKRRGWEGYYADWYGNLYGLRVWRIK